MMDFKQYIESMGSGFFVSFMDTGTKRISDDNISYEMRMPIESFLVDYFKSKNLFLGPEPSHDAPYDKSCVYNKYGKPMFGSVTGTVKTRLFAKKFCEQCIMLHPAQQNILVFDNTQAEKLVRSYLKQLTGLEKIKYTFYWVDIETTVECLIEKGFGKIPFKRKKKLFDVSSGLIETTFYEFALDESLDEKVPLTHDFETAFQNLDSLSPTSTKLRIFLYSGIDKLENQIIKLLETTPATDSNHENLLKVKDFIDTAKRKGVGVLIRRES